MARARGGTAPAGHLGDDHGAGSTRAGRLLRALARSSRHVGIRTARRRTVHCWLGPAAVTAGQRRADPQLRVRDDNGRRPSGRASPELNTPRSTLTSGSAISMPPWSMPSAPARRGARSAPGTGAGLLRPGRAPILPFPVRCAGTAIWSVVSYSRQQLTPIRRAAFATENGDASGRGHPGGGLVTGVAAAHFDRSNCGDEWNSRFPFQRDGVTVLVKHWLGHDSEGTPPPELSPAFGAGRDLLVT